MAQGRGFARWMFEDRATGRLVIGQKPNLTMAVFLVALAASFVVPAGRPALIVEIAQVGALAFWAFDELAGGVNPFRRLLGLGTLVGIVVWLVR